MKCQKLIMSILIKKILNLKKFKKSKIDYLSDYWSQVGLNIDKNITIKIKPFFTVEELMNLKNSLPNLLLVILKYLVY